MEELWEEGLRWVEFEGVEKEGFPEEVEDELPGRV